MRNKQRFDPNEPQNSWEVSYILSIFRPKVNIEIKQSQLFFTLGSSRCAQLREWADDNFNGRWVKEHTMPK